MRLKLLKHCLSQKVFSLISKHIVRLGKRKYWHIKKGSKVLLVAHVDTVCPPKFKGIRKDKLYATGLDDRLGVFLALTILSERNDVDVLITNDEEIGQSTAALVPSEELAKYNVILGLDREGLDFVDYGLASDELIDAYTEFAPFSIGAFSDICFFDSPPCSCINIGIGYYKAHSENSYAWISEIKQTHRNIHAFLDKHAGTHFLPPEENSDRYSCAYGFSVYSGERLCRYCGLELAPWEKHGCCDYCREYMILEHPKYGNALTESFSSQWH